MSEQNVISISGGKDSTALLLLAIERQTENLHAVFADTGHEHPKTYDYVRYLEQATGVPIRWVKADFAKDIERKAEFVRNVWPTKMAAEMVETVLVHEVTGEKMKRRRWSDDEIADKVRQALAVLKPTGVLFLDLCIWKGRFPSTRARFCSEELKHVPIMEQVHAPIIEAGDDVMSWQGVRADESLARRHLPELETKRTWPNGASLFNYRPILKWTAQDCFDMHRRHGIEHNPLYEQGMGRVGCMPCIHARKDEMLEIAKRSPEEVARVAEWERIVSEASKRGRSTFFEADTIPGNSLELQQINPATHGIHAVVEWSKTGRGGKQIDLLRADNDNLPLCSSIYGLCE